MKLASQKESTPSAMLFYESTACVRYLVDAMVSDPKNALRKKIVELDNAIEFTAYGLPGLFRCHRTVCGCLFEYIQEEILPKLEVLLNRRLMYQRVAYENALRNHSLPKLEPIRPLPPSHEMPKGVDYLSIVDKTTLASLAASASVHQQKMAGHDHGTRKGTAADELLQTVQHHISEYRSVQESRRIRLMHSPPDYIIKECLETPVIGGEIVDRLVLCITGGIEDFVGYNDNSFISKRLLVHLCQLLYPINLTWASLSFSFIISGLSTTWILNLWPHSNPLRSWLLDHVGQCSLYTLLHGIFRREPMIAYLTYPKRRNYVDTVTKEWWKLPRGKRLPPIDREAGRECVNVIQRSSDIFLSAILYRLVRINDGHLLFVDEIKTKGNPVHVFYMGILLKLQKWAPKPILKLLGGCYEFRQPEWLQPVDVIRLACSYYATILADCDRLCGDSNWGVRYNKHYEDITAPVAILKLLTRIALWDLMKKL